MIIVSFSGVDGAGKSTQVKLFTAYLKKEKVPIKKIHIIKNSLAAKLGFGACSADSVKPKIKPEQLINPKTAGTKVNVLDGSKVATGDHACPIGLFFRKLNMLADLLLFRWFIFWHKRKPLVVVFDRYFFDYLVNIYYLEKEDDPRLSPLLKSLMPKPDLAFFFDLEPKEALKRKQEQGLDYLTQKRNLFLKLKSNFGLKVISADQTPEAIAQNVILEYQKLNNQKNV